MSGARRDRSSATLAAIDSQDVRTAEGGGPRGYDADQTVKRRKRQALVDMAGRALVLDPRPGDVHDRDGAVPVLARSRRSSPSHRSRSPLCRTDSRSRPTRPRAVVTRDRFHEGRREPFSTCRILVGRTLAGGPYPIWGMSVSDIWRYAHAIAETKCRSRSARRARRRKLAAEEQKIRAPSIPSRRTMRFCEIAGR